MSKTYICYHSPCYDGFTAAFCAWKKFDNKVVYIPMDYSKPIPEFESKSEIYILDFSLDPEIIVELAKTHKVVQLDHHKTAMDKWSDPVLNKQTFFSLYDKCSISKGDSTFHLFLDDNSEIHFDMSKSGARMAWEYFFPESNIPELIKFVEDRDLWQFKYPQSKPVHAYLSSRPMTFEAWNQVYFGLEDMLHGGGRNKILLAGGTILSYQDEVVRELTTEINWTEIEGHKVPIVACQKRFGSIVCDKLLELHTETKFAVYYSDMANNIRQYGVRSRKDFDVSKIAEKLGGGGHAQAAGWVGNRILAPLS